MMNALSQAKILQKPKISFIIPKFELAMLIIVDLLKFE